MPFAREDLDSNCAQLASYTVAWAGSCVPWSTLRERKTWRNWRRSRSFTVVYGDLNARDSKRGGIRVYGKEKETRC
jgi:hypothetical protein